MRGTIAFLSGALYLASASSAPAQEITKPKASISNGRLPAPVRSSATQQPDGSIRLVWSPIPGALRYTVSRSVPPAPVALLTLPNPSDTVYIDRDVKPGSSYYYLIGGVNEDGIVGLKAATPPVMVGPVRVQAPAPPTGVKAALYGNTASITWNHAPGLRYQVDRATVTNTGPTGWQTVTTDLTAYGYSYGIQNNTPGTRFIYRVTAKDSLGMQSAPALSNEITVAAVSPADTTNRFDTTSTANSGSGVISVVAMSTNVRPAAVAEPSRLTVGDPVLNLGSSPMFIGLKLQKVRWISIDEAVATVDAQGQVRARGPGFTYVIANGVGPDGWIASLVKRIDVARR
jgi:hypothetical protein